MTVEYAAPRWTRWLFLYLAVLAGCTVLRATSDQQRTAVLVTSAIAIALNLVGVLTGSIRIRRKDKVGLQPVVQVVLVVVAVLGGDITADALTPQHHVPFLVHLGVQASAMSAAFAMVLIVIGTVRRVQRKRKIIGPA